MITENTTVLDPMPKHLQGRPFDEQDAFLEGFSSKKYNNPYVEHSDYYDFYDEGIEAGFQISVYMGE